jgi:hypothetical protein
MGEQEPAAEQASAAGSVFADDLEALERIAAAASAALLLDLSGDGGGAGRNRRNGG